MYKVQPVHQGAAAPYLPCHVQLPEPEPFTFDRSIPCLVMHILAQAHITGQVLAPGPQAMMLQQLRAPYKLPCALCP